MKNMKGMKNGRSKPRVKACLAKTQRTPREDPWVCGGVSLSPESQLVFFAVLAAWREIELVGS